jgi:lipopolysaccharide transport system permease protein
MTGAAAPGAPHSDTLARVRAGQPVAGPPRATPPTIIEPPGRWPGLGLAELWQFRSVGMALTRRNLMVRYRQTVVGVGWVLVQPLALVLVFTIFFGLVGRFGDVGVPFPVFYLSALWLWMPMTKVISEGTDSILANMQLVTRVYVPRALIPLSVAASTLVDLLFMFIAFGLLLLFSGFTPNALYLVAPVVIAVGYFTSLGLAYLLAAINARYRDAALALPFLIQLWFFVTPIIYPASWIPEEWEPVYYLNPMALVVTASRWIFADMPAPPPIAWPLGIIVSVGCLLLGYAYFRRREPTFADDL